MDRNFNNQHKTDLPAHSLQLLKHSLLINVFLVLFLTHANGQRLVIQKTESDIILDGVLDEPAWQELKPFSLIQHSPNFEAEVTEKTEWRMTYNDKYIFVSGFMKDSGNPRSFALTKDGGSESDDWFGLILDTFNDRENGLAFFTTPAGLRSDGTVLDGGINNIDLNFNWDTFWDVKTSVNEQGWIAEIRIPLSSLRFQNIEGKVVMGVVIMRFVSRLNEASSFPAIAPIYGDGSFFKVSQSREIEFEGMNPQNPVYIKPYLLAGLGELHEHNEQETELIRLEENPFEVGFDIKYNLTSNLALDATVNTDFAQVEVDNQEVNLSRFSFFFPEKRSFFMERASNFDMNFGYNNKVFYSRRIGLHEEEKIKILGGIRLVGRLGKWDIGLLNMHTEKSELLPSENLGVLRLRKQVFNPNSYLGLITTTRLGSNGDYNIVYGADATVKVIGEEYLKMAFAQSLENDVDANLLSNESTRWNVKWERRIKKGFGYLIEGSKVGIDYNPGLGFEGREDYKSINAEPSYTWYPEDSEHIFLQNLTAYSWLIFNDRTGIKESAQYGLGWSIQSKSGIGFSITPRYLFEYVDEEIEIDDHTTIPIRKYNYKDIMVEFNSQQSRQFKIIPKLEWGEFYDGKRFSSSAEFKWNQSRHLELGATYVYNNVKFKERNQKFLNHIVRLKVNLMFSTKLSVNSFIQYNNANDNFGSNIRVRFNPSEGHDLYLVYNQSSLLDNLPIHEINPELKSKAFLIKYNYTFKL
jgi:hypothetical protein